MKRRKFLLCQNYLSFLINFFSSGKSSRRFLPESGALGRFSEDFLFDISRLILTYPEMIADAFEG